MKENSVELLPKYIKDARELSVLGGYRKSLEIYKKIENPVENDSFIERQILKEIDYFKKFYGDLRPAVYLCYDRTAYFSNEDTSKINPDFNVFGGLQINAIPERDSLKWFGYRKNPAIPHHEAFETPAVAERLGCFDGFCFSSMHSVVKEHCYDE